MDVVPTSLADGVNFEPVGATGILGEDADFSTQVLEKALFHTRNKQQLYFFRIVNLSPNRRKRLKSGSDLTAEDVAITLHPVVKYSRAPLQVQVALQPCEAFDNGGNFAGGLCTWRLPAEVDVQGYSNNLIMWKIGDCMPIPDHTRDPLLTRVMADLLEAGSFEGVDPGQVVQRLTVLNQDPPFPCPPSCFRSLAADTVSS
jgi:hypothetical protein